MNTAIFSAGLLALLVTMSVHAENQELLRGEVLSADADVLEFSLSGESRQQVVDGTISFDGKSYRIAKVSVHNLVGAQRVSEQGFEYMVFSSSYSDQTAKGEPWVAAAIKHHCDAPYNSYLVIYSINSAEKLQRMTDIPYQNLTESVENSDSSELFCFIAKPPKEFSKK